MAEIGDATETDSGTAAVGNQDPDRVPTSIFQIDRTSDRSSFDLWQKSMAPLFEPHMDRHTLEQEGFFAEVTSTMLGYAMLSRAHTNRQRWARTTTQIARGGLDHYVVQLYERGGFDWESGSRTGTLLPGDLVVIDLSQGFVSQSADLTSLSLVVPRAELEGALSTPDDQNMRILSADQPLVRLLRDHLISLQRDAGALSLTQAAQVAPTTVGLLATCLNGVAGDNPGHHQAVATAQGLSVRRLIEKNLLAPELSVEWLLSRVPVSRTLLYELFEPHGGVGTYIRERRLRRALVELQRQPARDLPILELAAQCGYTSDTAFIRAFRRRFGITPGDARDGFVPTSWRGTTADGPDRRYENWLTDLAG